MTDNINEAQIPEICETEEDRLLSIGQLKFQYLQMAKQRFQGKVFVNKNTLYQIRVSEDGIREWWKKSRRRDHIISMQLLDYFLENGIFINEEPDYLHRTKIISASRFESRCKINGKLYKVHLITRKAIYDINKFKYFSLKEQ